MKRNRHRNKGKSFLVYVCNPVLVVVVVVVVYGYSYIESLPCVSHELYLSLSLCVLQQLYEGTRTGRRRGTVFILKVL